MIAIVWNDQVGTHYRQLSPQTFGEVLTWIGQDKVPLLITGTEPTQNPAVVTLCEQLVSPGRYAILRTNGLFRPELREVVMRTFSETELLLQNPRCYSPAAWEVLEGNLRYFSEAKRYPRVTLTVTLDDPDERFIYLLPLFREFHLYPILRIRVAPGKTLDQIKALTPAILNLVAVASGHGFRSVVEDLVMLCQFNTDQLEVLAKAAVVFRFVGEGGWFRILPDGKIAHWDAALTTTYERNTFANPRVAWHTLAEQEIQLRFAVPSFAACTHCLFWFNQRCQGGGLYRKVARS